MRYLNNNSTKKNIVFNMMKVASQILFPLITFPYISRVLSPEYVGVVNYANSIYSYLALIASLSISTYAVRTCSVLKNDKERLSTVGSEIYTINIVSTLISYILLTLLLFVPKFYDYRLVLILYSINLIFTTAGADWLNTAMEDFKYITIRTFIFQIIALTCMFLFVKNEDDYIKYVLITVLATSGGNIVNIFYRRKYCDLKIRLTSNVKAHLLPVIKFFASVITQQVYVNSDIIMIGWIFTNYQVGLYSVSSKIFNIVNTLLSSIFVVALPKASRFYSSGDYNTYNSFLRKVVIFIVGIGLPSCIGMFIASKEVIFLVGGEEYLEACTSLSILGIALFFSFFHGFIGNLTIIPQENYNIGLVAAVISSVANIVMNALLLPIFGYTVAAVTTMLAELISTVVLWTKIDKNIKIKNLFTNIFHCGFACLVMTIFIFLFRKINPALTVFNSITLIFSSGMIYGFVLLLLKDEFINEIFKFLKRR